MHNGLWNKYIDWSERNRDISLKEPSYNNFLFIKVQLIIKNYCDSEYSTSQCVFVSERDAHLKYIISRCLFVQSFVFVVDHSKQIIL
jgi:hypothetical protein